MIAIRNVEILSPIRAPFNEEYRFRITFECISPLEDGESGLRFRARAPPTQPSLGIFVWGAELQHSPYVEFESGCLTRV